MKAEKERSGLLLDRLKLLRGINLFADGLITWDINTQRIVFVNKGFEDITGFSTPEVMGKDRLDFLQGPETSDQVLETFYTIFQNPNGGTLNKISVELKLYKKCNRPFWCLLQMRKPEVEAASSSERQFEKEILETTLMATMTDITDRKNKELELIRMNQAAEMSVRTKNLFLSKISHEMRTPLNAIIASASIEQKESLSPRGTTVKHSDTNNIIAGSAMMLLREVDNILDITTLENGKNGTRRSDVRFRNAF